MLCKIILKQDIEGFFFPRLAVFFKEKSVRISHAYITDLADHFLGERRTQSPYHTSQEKVMFAHSYTITLQIVCFQMICFEIQHHEFSLNQY